MIWYGRDTTSAAAPEGTVVVLHLNLSHFSWDDANRAFRNVPLVSNRPLTIDDIRPFTRGELSLFIDEDGTRSVAIRSSKKDLPTRLTDSLGIIAKDMGKGVYLLSDRPLARMDWNPPHVWLSSLHSPFSSHIGSIHLLGADGMSGAVYASKEELSVRLPKQRLSKLSWRHIPEGTIAAMSTPALPNADISGVSMAMDAVLSSYQTPSVSNISSQILAKSGMAILTHDGNAFHFLIISDDSSFTRDQQRKMIQVAAALQTPRIEAFQLPDTSTAKEIIVDPSYSTVEEITIAGTLVSRTSTSEGGYFYLANKDETFAISDDQSLVEFWLASKNPSKKIAACHANSLFLNVRSMMATSATFLSARSLNTLNQLGNQFSIIGVEEKWLHTVIHSCY